MARTGFYAFLNVFTVSSGPLFLNAFIGVSKVRQFKYESFFGRNTLYCQDHSVHISKAMLFWH